MQAPDAGGNEAAALVRRIVAGDRAAEAELVERYSRPVSYLLRRVTGDPTLSDDLHQETFRVVLEKARGGQIRQPERLAGFVRSTARNLAIGEFRKRRRRAEEGEPGLLESRPDSGPSPFERAVEAEDRLRVRRLLGELRSQRDRQVLFRFHLQQEDRAVICADLGLTRPQFNLVLFRARRRFRELVLKDLEEGSPR